MKKYRFAAIFLALLLSLSLIPSAGALHPERHDHSGVPLVAEEEDADLPRATAAIVVDGDTGEVLYEYNAHERRYPASLTKIMTSLVVLDAVARGELSLDTEITASASAVRVPYGSSTANPPIQAGEILTVEQLLYCDLLPSANEACNILAEAVTGLTGAEASSAFAQRMNDKAAELGLTGTHFVNPHGLHDEDHYSTAYDIYLMSRAAMENPTFRKIVGTGSYVIPATNLNEARTLYSTNAFLSSWYILGYRYSKAIGIKTGHTDEAGRCLSAAATDDEGRTFYCVLLGSEQVWEGDTLYAYSFSESERLLEWAFDGFRRVTLLDRDTDNVLREVKVTLSDETDHVLVQPSGAILADMPADFDPEKAEMRFTLPDAPVEAPVNAGDVLGSVEYFYGGISYGKLDLVAADSVARSDLLYALRQAEYYWSLGWVKATVICAAIVLVLVIGGIVVLLRRRRRHYAYSGSRNRGGRRTSYRGRR